MGTLPGSTAPPEPTFKGISSHPLHTCVRVCTRVCVHYYMYVCTLKCIHMSCMYKTHNTGSHQPPRPRFHRHRNAHLPLCMLVFVLHVLFRSFLNVFLSRSSFVQHSPSIFVLTRLDIRVRSIVQGGQHQVPHPGAVQKPFRKEFKIQPHLRQIHRQLFVAFSFFFAGISGVNQPMATCLCGPTCFPCGATRCRRTI